MGQVQKTVFLSYRRTNSAWALAVFQDLTHHGYDVFLDFKKLNSGDFESVILASIKARAHFVVILTPSALERCSDSNDWIRREIETAIATQRNIVPLMLEGSDFDTPSIANQLKGTLAPLRHYNGLRIHAEYFDEGMLRLRERYLNVPLEAVLHPLSASVQENAKQQQLAAVAAPIVQPRELTAQELFERGNTRFVDCDFDGAITDYNEAIQLKSDFPSAYYHRGMARYEKGDFVGAIKDHSEAIRLESDFHEAFDNRGNARKAIDDFDGAIQDHTEAIRLKPDYSPAYSNRGSARKAKGDFDGAIKDHTEAIRLKPDFLNAFNNRGNARQAKGDFDGAIRDYTEAIRLKPGEPDMFHNRGTTRYNKGDFDGAIMDYTEAIRLKSDFPEAFYGRGNARQAKDDFDGAIKDYAEAIRLRPDFTPALKNLSLVRLLKFF
jgi:tetratricopeptide (TPR) repeat protein